MQRDHTVDEIAQEVGASRSTIYSWLTGAGLTGNRMRLGLPVESGEMQDQVGEILANQHRFMDDIDKMTEALTALRTEQESNRGGWMAAINEARHEIEEASSVAGDHERHPEPACRGGRDAGDNGLSPPTPGPGKEEVNRLSRRGVAGRCPTARHSA